MQISGINCRLEQSRLPHRRWNVQSSTSPPRNIHQKYGYHCWWRTCLGPFLAKTSRTAVLTAIMDLSAGGRLYKCLYKMHVDSRAFWGAFSGAFRVFLRDVG